VATTHGDDTVKVWDAATGAEIQTFGGDLFGGFQTVAFSPDGTQVLAGSYVGTAKLWSVASGAEILRFSTGDIRSIVAFSPDGAQVLTGWGSGDVMLWNAVTGEELVRFSHSLYGVQSAVFSPDGTRILTGSYDGTTFLWGASTTGSAGNALIAF
jgi:WD40 repeat protein